MGRPQVPLAAPGLKTYLPPGATCWEGRKRQTWNGFLDPFPRPSFRFAACGGAHGAARHLL